ncbi:unnamed protein product [Strongylus vulgaris]|uniref:Uncharacterized protein n=1 Tax=Strongylus vulgaris TaxID=40348 RepID=A0A3P7LUW5_STRVU|nr:unnamed protein product [Strongylus vulgaris]
MYRYVPGMNTMPQVMTLVATPEGLQLKLPSSGLNNSQNAKYGPALTVPQQYPPSPDGANEATNHIVEKSKGSKPSNNASRSTAADGAGKSKIKAPTPIGQLKSPMRQRVARKANKNKGGKA